MFSSNLLFITVASKFHALSLLHNPQQAKLHKLRQSVYQSPVPTCTDILRGMGLSEKRHFS